MAVAIVFKELPALPSLPSADADLAARFREVEKHPRHFSCINPSGRPLSAGETRATPLVICSKGPVRDPRHFYSTAYSTTYNTKYWNKGVDAVDGKGTKIVAASLTPSQMRKQRTGYAYNVVPYVEYDKRVDEGPTFSIKEPFGTFHKKHYKPPTPPSPAIGEPVNAVTDSGFTHMPPKCNVTTDGTKWRDMTTTAKTSYDARRFHFKDAVFDKSMICPSESGYVHDAGHIKAFGNDDDSERFKRPSRSPPTERNWRDYNTSRMDEDGYTRSAHGNILQINEPTDTVRAKEYERIRHRDPTRWMHLKDPHSWMSTSRIVHSPKHPLTDTMHVLQSPVTRVGGKEPQGSVRNNPVYLTTPPPDSNYVTETADRYGPPKDPFPISRFPNVDEMTKTTGFTRGNNYQYTFAVPNDVDALKTLHPTIACAHRQAEGGLFSVKPTQSNLSGCGGKVGCKCG